MDGTRKEPSQHFLAFQIANEIQESLQFPNFNHELQQVVASDDVSLSNFNESVIHQLQRGSLDTKLRNLVYHWLRERCKGMKPSSKEPLDYLRKAQGTWEGRLWKSLISVAREMKSPLARGRLNSEQEMIEENWSEISQWDLDLSRFKPVYSPKDFLDCLLAIRNPNYELKGPEKLWSSFPGIPIKVTSLRELKSVFADLTTNDPHYALIQTMEAGDLAESSSFLKSVQANRIKLGEIVESKRCAVTSQEYLKKGCTTSRRGKIWQNVLGSHVTPEHSRYYQELKQSVTKSDLLIDRIILKDVQLTATNNDEYFVFEDSLYQTLLCFTRDVSLLDLFERSSKSPMRGVAKGKPGGRGPSAESAVIYPFNGILPFHGFTMYVAPLCSLYDDPECLYFTFRSLYCRYWFRLHEISSHENGILSLCLLFEKILHRHETELWLHLKALHILPIRVVFKWLIKGFSGYLPAEQLHHLWDLLLAYNSVQIFPLFAVGVLSLRRSNLMRATQSQTVEGRLQHFLSSCNPSETSHSSPEIPPTNFSQLHYKVQSTPGVMDPPGNRQREYNMAERNMLNSIQNGRFQMNVTIGDGKTQEQFGLTGIPNGVQITTSEEDTPYDPFANRKIDHPTSNFDTAIHLLKGNIGTGILAMPEAFKNAGLAVGTIGLVVIGIICVHTMHLLLNCARELSKRTRTPFLNFAQVGELSFKHGPPMLRPFSNMARIMIDTFLCLTQLGFCCVYFVFVATNLRLFILEQFDFDLSVKIYLAILLLPLIFLNWIRNLKLLSPVMTIANLCMSVGLGIIFYYIFRDIRPIQGREEFNVFSSSLDHLALYFGTAIYAFEGIGMILPLENKMKNPQDFGGWRGVLNFSMLIVGVLYIAVGFFGYVAYGAKAAGSITLNLPAGEWLASTVRIVMALSIFLSYALQFYVPMSIAWPVLEKKIPLRAQRISEYAFRTTLVLFTFALAECVPNLGLVISLVGALCASSLGLILPPIFALCTNWAVGYGTLRWKMWKDLSLLSFGVIGCVAGTYVSLLEIAHH